MKNFVWKKAVKKYEQNIIDECIESYKLKMNKLHDGKKTLATKIIRNTHEMALEFSLKTMQKNTFFNEDLEDRACEAINN